MNVAVIFAGGTGQRMNSKTLPKQFLELHGKPILIYTIEVFEKSKDIDSIILVSHPEWIEYTQSLLEKYRINKVQSIVGGGKTGQESIYNGLKKAAELNDKESVVLIHDGVRPIIDHETIHEDIECVIKHGTAITVSPATETIVQEFENHTINNIIDRKQCWIAKAPQCFRLNEILSAHERAISEGKFDFIDSASMMRNYGYELHTVEGKPENLKITTPSDYYIFRAIVEARENSQIYGLG